MARRTANVIPVYSSFQKHSSRKMQTIHRNTMKPNIEELIASVRQWGRDKGITGPNGKGTLLGQLSKTQEELTETRDAAIHWRNNVFVMITAKGKVVVTKKELEDGIGDTTVTLILAAEMAGLTIEDCLAAAYSEIANRKGTMINGQFVKEEQDE
jgi:NTP pyrophosphatase (non-canonical NTP hydrolase)